MIGNPLAVIRQIGGGAKDLFYEPYQGAIEGPEAFIVGVGHGISSLAGSTVGGVAGAVSKITSTVGKGKLMTLLKALLLQSIFNVLWIMWY